MAHVDKHTQTEPVHVKETQGNTPGEAKQTEPSVGGLIDPGVPVHQVKPVPAGSLVPGQEGAVSLHYIIQPDGTTAHVYGFLEGTGGASCDLGVLPCLTVS
jgi:hypothetical protein